MGDFRLKATDAGRDLETTRAIKASATVIEAGDLVALDTGLIIKATAASTAVAWCPEGGADGETVVEVTVGNGFTLEGTADANYAVTDKGAEVDLVVNGGAQQIDLGTSTTDVFKVGISEDAGTAGAATNVEVRINKPLY